MPRSSTSRKAHTKLKTAAQVGRIFGLARAEADLRGVTTKDQVEETIFCNIERNPRISELTFDEANLIIKAFGGEPFSSYGKSIRTMNYRKQAAGIKSIETDAQLKLIRSLAAERNMSDAGLEKLATRMNLPWPPNTTHQGNSLVEALKAMNERDRDATRRERANGHEFPSPKSKVQSPKSSEPSFRRVA